MVKSFFVPRFTIADITNCGMDSWVEDPTHIRHKYGFLTAILEHIKNTNYCEPIKITYHNSNEVNAGPSGVARLHALKTIEGWTDIPAIVTTNLEIAEIDWVEITTKEQLRSYFLLEPKEYGIDADLGAFWHNQNPNREQATATLQVSKITLDNFLKCL